VGGTYQNCLSRLLIAISQGYLAFLVIWLAATILFGDRIVYLGLLNLVGVYLFLPLPIALLAAIFSRQKGMWLGVCIGLLAFLWFWGGLFAPWRLPKTRQSQPEELVLTVMTYNVLAWHPYTKPVIETIQAEDADVVLLQEVNTGLARALQEELGQTYPYQATEPLDNPSGIGVISKYPLRSTGDQLPHHWIGGPLLLEMEWKDRTIRLVDFHMLSTTRLASYEVLSAQFSAREEQARLMVDYARQGSPAILGGDANAAAPFNMAYRILAGELQDVWVEAGFGLGHTFPGSDLPGSSRPRIGPVYVPQWLARIDYIFHSDHWETLSAHLAQIDGASDHRGVVATLRLIDLESSK